MKKKKIIAIIILITAILLILMNSTSKATIVANNYFPGEIDITEVEPITNVAGTIANTLSIIGIVIAVIALSLIGIKYMIGSVEEKAEYKKTMIPYIVGVVMIVAITQILNLVMNVVNNIKA